MRLSEVSVFITIIGLIHGDDNRLLGVPVFVSENANSAVYLNDDDTTGYPMSFGSTNVKWAVFDLGDAYQLSSIVMWNGGHGESPISFYVGNEFLPCKFHRQISQYALCAENVIQTGDSNEIVCKGSESTGRYLAMVKGDFPSDKNLESLDILELQAFGTLVPGHTFPVRPVIESEDIDPIPADAFKIAKTLLAGVDTITVPRYSTTLMTLNNNCQPIIWDPSTINVFSIACTTSNGKGRFVVFSKESYFNSITTGGPTNQLAKNLLNWLAPNSKNPSVVSTKSIATIGDLNKKVKKGDIVDFYTWISYSKEFLDAIIALCLDGTISITLDHNFWSTTASDVSDSFKKILYAFGVDFNPDNYITWDSSQDFTITDNDFVEDIVGADYMLANMVKNNDYFMRRGSDLAKSLLTISPTLVTKSNVGSLLKKLIKKYDSLLNWICPCEVGQAVDTDDRKIISIYSSLVSSQGLVNSDYKLPCVDIFPGDFDQTPPKTSATISIKSQTDSTYHPIGFYLAAGATLDYQMINIVGDWSISVGCHPDVLNDDRSKWSRYPSIVISSSLLNDKGQIYSPFGGVLWLKNSAAGQSITVKLSNIVASPFFNGRDPLAAKNWENQLKNPGLWSQISGENIVICEKTSLVKSYGGDYLGNLMKNYWDKLIRMDYAITSRDWSTDKPTYVTLDVMTSFGYGHSGYPVVLWYDWHPSLFNKTLIDTIGSWGMCHEIGHNRQENTWTYAGLDEVTNNVLCLFNYDKLWKLERYGDETKSLIGNEAAVTDYLNNGANYDEYKNNPWIELAIYSQMADSMGWGFFKKVFAYYQKKNLDPSDDSSKLCTWVVVTSTISGQNLTPLFEFWGIPIDDGDRDEVSAWPCFFPDDFITKFSPTRVSTILSKYPGCSRVSIFFEDYDPAADIKGTLPNYITLS